MAQAREQLLIEPRVPLFLVEELGEVLLRHGGFGGAGGQRVAYIYLMLLTHSEEEANA